MKSFIKIISLLLIFLMLFSGCNSSNGTAVETNGKPESAIPNENCEHRDEDNNGECDTCRISVLVEIDFFAVNDLHGKFANTNTNEGVDELTTYLKNAYSDNENTILISSGDMWQGSSESNLTKGLIITDWMNEVGFTSMTLGNHEFDWGEEFVKANAESAEFEILAINIFDRETNKLVEYASPSTVVDLGTVQIGIIGAIGNCYSSIAGDKSTDFYFKNGKELTELVKDEATRLRESGVDYIVYSIHAGFYNNVNHLMTISENLHGSYYDISLSDGYVDLVFEGHTHKRYVFKDKNGVYHLQGGGENKAISHVEINYNYVNDKTSTRVAELVNTESYVNLEDDPLVSGLLNKYSEDISAANQMIGINSSYRNATVIKQKVAELYYQVGQETWGKDYDIYLGGGYITTRNPYNLDAGKVKYSVLQSLLPFDNQIVLCSVKGSDLKEKFIETTNKNYYIQINPIYKNSQSDIDPDKTYYIIVDTYTSSYAPNNLTVVDKYTDGVFARDLLAQFIKDGGWI